MSQINGRTNLNLNRRRALKLLAKLQTQQLAAAMIDVRIQYLQLSSFDLAAIRMTARRHGFAPTLNRMLSMIDPTR